jgi:iron complex outermembrane receptor protein
MRLQAHRKALLPVFVLALPLLGAAQEPAPEPSRGKADDLFELSLEELMNVEVTVASRRAEPLRDVPAAVYVLTGEEIRRAGHTSIQEALRMVPGFHVAQWETSGWDVTARGFTGSLSTINESFANQLLLVVDGITLNSPAMAGIWWPLYDIPIDEIDRIEIIRGPAGTMWGANAMNGVVHVITKHPKETQGLLATSTIGRNEQRGGLRQGGKLGDNGWYRAFASYAHHDALPNADGDTFPEDWHIGTGGLRADWDLGERGRTRLWTLFYGSEFGDDPVDNGILGLPQWDDTPKNGGVALASWEFGPPEDTQRIQGWYTGDFQKQTNLDSSVQVIDVEYTRYTQLSERNQLTWGLGYRLSMTDMQSDNGYNDFDPQYRNSSAGRVFAQDEIAFPALKSKLSFGAQLEQSDVGNFSYQPNVRWMWHATEQTALWAGISRAVRTPSREEIDIIQYFDPVQPPFFLGNRQFENETVLSYEIGVRTNITERAQLDLSTFYNTSGASPSGWSPIPTAAACGAAASRSASRPWPRSRRR